MYVRLAGLIIIKYVFNCKSSGFKQEIEKIKNINAFYEIFCTIKIKLEKLFIIFENHEACKKLCIYL